MPQLSQSMLTSTEYNKICNKFSTVEKSKREGFTLLKLIAKTYLKQFLTILAYLLVYVVMQTVSPYLTALMMRYIAHKEDYADYYGVMLFVFVIVLEIVKSIS